MRSPNDPARITSKLAANLCDLMNENAAIVDKVLPVERESGSLWYARARAAIAAAADSAGAPVNRMARVIAHLSIGTRWELQEESLPHVAKLVADACSGRGLETLAFNLRPWTLYDHVAEYAARYALTDVPVIDDPMKSRQFYGALFVGGEQWYVSDTHDLQLRGMLTPATDGRLFIHQRLEDAMSSVMIYRGILSSARATLAEPCARQAERWVWYRSNMVALKTGRHPDIVAQIVDCPISTIPMVKWCLR